MTRGILAGIVATIMLSLLIVGLGVAGVVPEFNLISEIFSVLLRLGLSPTPFMPWVVHFLIGAVIYGMAFVALEPILPGNSLLEGVTFGVLIWLLMLIVFIPLAGHSLFGLDFSGEAIAVMLGLNVFYGAILGLTYGALAEEEL